MGKNRTYYIREIKKKQPIFYQNYVHNIITFLETRLISTTISNLIGKKKNNTFS